MKNNGMVAVRRHLASEKRSLDYCIQNYPYHESKARECIAQLKQFIDLDANSRILEVGAAQGSLLIALERLGYSCDGIEPCEHALETSLSLASALNGDLNIVRGCGESIPYADGCFDCVLALYVMEHVEDARAVCREAFRVLKPGGVFYFSTTNSLCPMQDEIGLFPLFSWYPDRLKARIMRWACEHRPSLVGYTDTPATNWFTPRKAARMLRGAGFEKVYDTWDVIMLPGSQYTRKAYVRMALRVIRLNSLTRWVAYVLLPAGLHCIAVKGE